MAYVRPIVRVRENGRRIIRGGHWDGELGRSVFQATQDEIFKINVDFTDILDSATITAAASADGVTATPTVAAGVVTLAISNATCSGDIDLTVTFSDSRVIQEFLRVNDMGSWSRDDYGLVRVQ